MYRVNITKINQPNSFKEKIFMKQRQKKKTDKISLRLTIQTHLRGYKLIRKENPHLFLSIFLCSATKAVTPYVGIYLSALIINELAGARNADRLSALVVTTVCTTALLALLNAILQHWKTSNEAPLRFTNDKVYVNKMLNMEFSALDNQHTHDLRSQIKQNDSWMGWGLGRLARFFSDAINGCFSIVSAAALTASLFILPVPESAGVMTVLNHPLFLVGIIALLLLATALAPFFANKAASHYVEIAEYNKFANRSFFFFGMIGIQETKRAPDIRMYEQQKIFAHYGKEFFSISKNMGKIFTRKIGPMYALSSAVSVVFLGLVYVFVCLKAWCGAFGVGSVTQYIGAITMLSQGISLLFQTIGDMKNNVPFLNTAYEFLDIPNTMYQGSLTTEKRADRQYEVEFKNVSFKYPNTDVWALRHVSMKFRVGSRLAIVGENGSGKTTFIKLLCRLYDPQEGEILLNGIDIRKYDYRDYMQIFSVAFQDFQLLSQPLGCNVAGKSDYDKARVEQCLRDAGFEDRVYKMPKGLDTFLYREFDEQGVEISGGEAQKIAISRALYKDTPFIILDEPTAALDPIAEAEIYSKFDSIAGDRTTICISHRLSSCKFCDEILVFDHGQIVQQGSHETLVATDGKYESLWNAQARWYTMSEENQAAGS